MNGHDNPSSALGAATMEELGDCAIRVEDTDIEQ